MKINNGITVFATFFAMLWSGTAIALENSGESHNQTKNEPAQESKRAIIYDSAIDFAEWVDEFFAEEQGLESASYDYLRLVNTFGWRETEGVEYRPRIRAKVNLPKMDRKLSLMFADTNEIAQSELTEIQSSEFFVDGKDEKLSAALNYESDEYNRSKFDSRVGLDSSVDIFAMIKHTFNIYKSEKTSFRNFNYIFWKEKEHFGVNSRIELNRVIDENSLFRWKYSILRSEKSEGNEWRNTLSIVEQYSAESWLSYDFDMIGLSDRSYDVETYRIALRYRYQLSTEWLFFEVEPEFLWQRVPGEPHRKSIPGLIFRIEIKFED